jgi:hypothetical protein
MQALSCTESDVVQQNLTPERARHLLLAGAGGQALRENSRLEMLTGTRAGHTLTPT